MQIIPNLTHNTKLIKKKKICLDVTLKTCLPSSSESIKPEMLFKNDVVYYTTDFILSDLNRHA